MNPVPPYLQDDERLERELEAALSVDPSPEFLVRVRARVAQETPAHGRAFRWLAATGLAVATATLVIVLQWPDRGTQELAPPPLLPSDTVAVVTPSTPPALTPPTRPAAVAVEPVRPPSRVSVTRSRGAEPTPEEVIVSAAEVAGFELLLTRLQQGAFAGMNVLEDSPDRIQIDPIAIEPLWRVEATDKGVLP